MRSPEARRSRHPRFSAPRHVRMLPPLSACRSRFGSGLCSASSACEFEGQGEDERSADNARRGSGGRRPTAPVTGEDDGDRPRTRRCIPPDLAPSCPGTEKRTEGQLSARHDANPSLCRRKGLLSPFPRRWTERVWSRCWPCCRRRPRRVSGRPGPGTSRGGMRTPWRRQRGSGGWRLG